MKCAIGITTFNRPTYLAKSLRAIATHVAPIVEAVYVHNDGSDRKHHAEYQRAYKRLQTAIVQDSTTNEGVAKSKNALLRAMLDDTDADYLFLIEDDILITSPKAITGYVDACEKSSFQHLSFAHHGTANAGRPNPSEDDDVVSFYPHCVGAFAVFSRECLQSVGLFDTLFLNAWEHCEFTLRLAQAGYTSGAYRFADATWSRDWLSEVPGSLDKSSIRPRSDWRDNIRNGLIYWRDEKPETYNELFGDDKPLAAYAKSITG